MKNTFYEWTKEANLKCYRCQQGQLNSCHTEKRKWKWKWKWHGAVTSTINNWENADKKRINIPTGTETILENWPFCFSSLSKGFCQRKLSTWTEQVKNQDGVSSFWYLPRFQFVTNALRLVLSLWSGWSRGLREHARSQDTFKMAWKTYP